MGRTKHGQNITTADRIRAALKSAGYKARAITVREPHYGDVTVTIRDASIRMADVKRIADEFRKVRTDEATGEILLGGNTYVEVEYHDSVIEPLAALIAPKLAAAPQGIAVAIGDVEVFWHLDSHGGNRIVSKVTSSPGEFRDTYAGGWGPGSPNEAQMQQPARGLAVDLLSRGVGLDATPAKQPTCVTCNDTGGVYTAGQVTVECPTCSPDPEPTPPARNDAPEVEVEVEVEAFAWTPEVGGAPAVAAIEWFDAPWSCGHRDPVYIGPHAQRCAVCALERFEPGHEPPPEVEAAADELPLKCRHCGLRMRLLEIDADPPEYMDEQGSSNCADAPNHEPEPVLSPSACRPLAPFPDRERLKHEIPFSLAQAAHAGSSFVPERRAEQERESYAAQLVADYETLSKYATTDEKRATLDEEFARYKAGYRQRYLAHLSANSRCMSTMIAGASNFPTARNRKRLDVAHKRLEDLIGFRERALDAIRKALCPELRPVMAGDEDAVERLRDKIAKAEALQALMSDANAAIRKHAREGETAQVAALVALGFSEPRARDLLVKDFAGRIGFASYELQNNGANIRRMKGRLEQITAAKSAEVVEEQGEAARLEDNPGDNRVRLYFPGKPAAEVRGRLKSAGFRWAPSVGAWQAYRNHRTISVARTEAGITTEA